MNKGLIVVKTTRLKDNLGVWAWRNMSLDRTAEGRTLSLLQAQGYVNRY